MSAKTCLKTVLSEGSEWMVINWPQVPGVDTLDSGTVLGRGRQSVFLGKVILVVANKPLWKM